MGLPETSVYRIALVLLHMIAGVLSILQAISAGLNRKRCLEVLLDMLQSLALTSMKDLANMSTISE